MFRIKRDTHCSDQFTDFLLNYVISFWDLNFGKINESFGAKTVQRKKETWIFLTKEKIFLISKRKCNSRVSFENIDVLSFHFFWKGIPAFDWFVSFIISLDLLVQASTSINIHFWNIPTTGIVHSTFYKSILFQ